MTATSALLDPRAQAVVDRLHAQGRAELSKLRQHFLWRSITHWLRGRRFIEPDRQDDDFLSDKLIPLDPPKCEFCYLLCRSLAAKHVAEIGTSFGVSTIYLAAAMRDNGGGRVIGTEIDPRKVAVAQKNLADAGVAEFAEVRAGDALHTLADPGGPLDFLLIDSWVGLARPAIELLKPHLRAGAIVMCDNTGSLAAQYRDYLAYVHNADNGFQSLTIPYQGGFELSVRN